MLLASVFASDTDVWVGLDRTGVSNVLSLESNPLISGNDLLSAISIYCFIRDSVVPNISLKITSRSEMVLKRSISALTVIFGVTIP